MDVEEKICAIVSAQRGGVELSELLDKLFPPSGSTHAQHRAVQKSDVRRLVSRLRQEGRLATERRGDRLLVVPPDGDGPGHP